MTSSVRIKDVAELSGAPEAQLCRVIRLMATVGFLCEPQPDHVAHTPLSASFVSRPSFHDAAMFLSESIVPAGLQMIQSIEGRNDSHQVHNFVPPTLKQGANANRRWSAYLHHIGHLQEDLGVNSILQQLNWRKIINLPEACIVEVFHELLIRFFRESKTPISFASRLILAGQCPTTIDFANTSSH